MADESDELELETETEELPIEGDPVEVDEEEEIGFEDEVSPASVADQENSTIRQMRKRMDEMSRELAARPPKAATPEPTFEGCGFDEEVFRSATVAWAKEQATTPVADPAAELETAFSAAHAKFVQGKGKMARADYDIAAAAVEATLSLEQQSALILAADDAAKLIYALGKSPAKLALLASHTNPIKLAAEVAKLERQVIAGPRRQPPPPADRVPGSAPSIAGGIDAHLVKLEKAADQSGDRTELIKYRRSVAA